MIYIYKPANDDSQNNVNDDKQEGNVMQVTQVSNTGL